MMKPTQHRQGYDFAQGFRLDLAAIRRIFVQREMRAGAIIIAEISLSEDGFSHASAPTGTVGSSLKMQDYRAFQFLLRLPVARFFGIRFAISSASMYGRSV
jgi:hypothetical protein